MFSRQKGWIPGLLSRPKNPHSLEHLKYLYSLLMKNQTITENNRSLLVETLRSISEILIWGDQNDSSVFDFFLEKNMLSFFLKYLQQRAGRYICVQLLQTLNILFENIKNETSLYYLLSNNHINSIIVHKFDFSDEEVMAYYISFLKTLSLKLNKHTIHFFYNEHTNDFALYTEAIKFFNHSESMVRIAVRTITLNVFKVEDKAMLRYIRDRTAAPYFSNLVWFIGNHILNVDLCVRHDADHQSRNRLADLVAEHLDHLHYLNDILCINIDTLNEVLTDQFLNRLLIPLYVYCLTMRKKHNGRQGDKKHISSVVALYLLSQVFLIISYAPLVRQLAEIIFQGDISVQQQEASSDSPQTRLREFVAPDESLEATLESNRGQHPFHQGELEEPVTTGNSTFYMRTQSMTEQTEVHERVPTPPTTEADLPTQNSTDEEKLYGSQRTSTGTNIEQKQTTFSLENRAYLEAIFNALECSENDYEALFALCLLYAMGHNDGIHQGLMDTVMMPTEKSETKDHYNVALVERLIKIITLASQSGNKVRLSTLELTIKLLKQLVYMSGKSYLQDRHLASIENARECCTQLLRNFYKSEEMFLDMFEDEYREMKNRPLNVEYLTMDASILLPPTGTPLTGIAFSKRLPCGEVERARRAIRVFFLVRDLSLTLLQETESQLPLTKEDSCIKVSDILDLNNSDLIACTVVTKERKMERRFLVIDSIQLILVEPDTKRLGWGVVRFAGFLQDVEVTGDKDDSRSLHITIHKPPSSQHARPLPLLSGRFVFDDHIRCMAAKQRLTKGRLKARQQKMMMIERLLDIPNDGGQRSSTPSGRNRPYPGRSHPIRSVSTPSQQSQETTPVSTPTPRSQQVDPIQSMPIKSHGQETINESTDSVEIAEEAFAYQTFNQHTGTNASSRHTPSPVDNSPFQEIQMEDLSKRKKKHSKKMPNVRLHQMTSSSHSRSHSHSPKREEGLSSNRGHSYSMVEESKRERSSTPKGRGHSNSQPIPEGKRSRPSSGSSSDESHKIRTRSKESQSPKTLRPAEEPALTLFSQDSESMATSIDSLKLVPPAESLRTPSDTSSTGTSNDGQNSGVENQDDKNSESSFKDSKPNFAFKSPSAADVEISKARVESVARAKSSSATDQLTKLAQIVQEHFSDDKQSETGLVDQNTDM
ncbi:protein CLEC16A-like isoform X2 [Mytilus californianus]|uniref:protein CLEC16A-like isoform X2 n=1 Tax=Mytilus californianus TaxID=6549 RepID=UPI002245AB30|nr:protein CLEC16A-like isoform X2 [Mytilus californianus]